MALDVLIVAHIPLIREGLRALLADERDLRVTALPPSSDLVDDLLVETPDVLLLDIQVLEREGWRVLDELHRTFPALAILILGDEPQDRRVTRALELGARGYLLRESSADEMAAAIRAAYTGITTLHPQITAALLETIRAQENAPDEETGASDLIEPLSERELDVLRLMTRGRANKQIAAELFITEHTVKFHIRSILGKLGAANRTEAVTLGLQKGLVSL